MSHKRSHSPKRKKSRVPSVLRIAVATPPIRSAVVLFCLLLSGVAEGIGVASLIPILAAAGDPSGAKSGMGATVMRTLDTLGLPTDLLTLIVILVVAMIGKALLQLAAMRQVGHAVAEVGTHMRLGLVSALLDARWSFFVREPMGRFANALGIEAMRASEAYSSVAQFLSGIIQAMVYLGIAAALSWKLAAFALGIGLVMMLSLSRFIIITRRNARKQTKRTKIMIGRLADVLVGLKPMKAMGRQARVGALFARDINTIDLAMRRQLFARHASKVLQEPIIFICIGLGTYFGSTYAGIPLPELVVMSIVLVKTVMVIGKVQEDLQSVQVAESGYWSIHGAIEDAKAARETTKPGRMPTLNKGMELRDVSMAFGDKVVFDHASFFVPTGGITAIIGASGAGKTTMVDLILGLHQATLGEILIDDQPLSEIDVIKWRSLVGYVPQELILFHESIMANVTLGEPSFTPADVEKALRQAGAWDFVATLPDGMHHVVGERGALLSGGQRQRIALARALIHRPKLLILDEATSALDPMTEAGIVRNVRDLVNQGGITVLSISHQPAWMTVADKVIRVEDGIVTETTPDMFPKVVSL
ncbi:ABC transporter ATP-binding protein [Hypericibacter sp.]|uniref:ABC transporter ATP-binding protein n=1 Tax=Hypericibacter sp. TaxID=2705401 RepID=UPI003D6CB4D6